MRQSPRRFRPLPRTPSRGSPPRFADSLMRPQDSHSSSSSMIRYQTDDEGVVLQPEYTLTRPSNGPNDRDHLNRHGLRVTVAHYPPATSKWNPIEHRLFCVVSKNWAGRPLDSYETILKYLRTTRTATGLRVRAHLVRKTYKTGVKVTDAQMRELRITPNSFLPKWNYTIEPM